MNQETRDKLKAMLTKEVERLRAKVEGEGGKYFAEELYKWEACLLEFDWKMDREDLKDEDLLSVIRHRDLVIQQFQKSTDVQARIATSLERIASAMEKS